MLETQIISVFHVVLRCGNMNYLFPRVMKDHLIVNGFDPTYVIWNVHGELPLTESSTDSKSDNSESVEDGMGCEQDELPSNVYMGDEGNDVFSEECMEFRHFVEDGNALYLDCESHTKLNVLVKLFNLKAKQGMNDVAYIEWLTTISDILPPCLSVIGLRVKGV